MSKLQYGCHYFDTSVSNRVLTMALQNCPMCYFKYESNDYMLRHVVRYHQLDPRFKVQCNKEGCSATFTKWKSYQRHVSRKHNEILNENYACNDFQDHNEDDGQTGKRICIYTLICLKL